MPRTRRGVVSRRRAAKAATPQKPEPSSAPSSPAASENQENAAAPRTRAICKDIARLRSSVEELEVEVDCRVDEMRQQAASLAQSLRFAFRTHLAKLPSRIRSMSLATFAERYAGSVESVMGEEAERREDDLKHWVSQTPALTARRTGARARVYGVADGASDSASESDATSLTRTARRRTATATRRATATLRRAQRYSVLRKRVEPETPLADGLPDGGGRRLTRSMRRSIMMDPETARGVAASASHDSGAGLQVQAAAGGVVNLNSPSADDMLGKADINQLKAMQERMQALISKLEQ